MTNNIRTLCEKGPRATLVPSDTCYPRVLERGDAPRGSSLESAQMQS